MSCGALAARKQGLEFSEPSLSHRPAPAGLPGRGPRSRATAPFPEKHANQK